MLNIGIAYWIAGLRATAASFFFFYFGSLVLSLFWLAAAVAYSALFPVLPIAQILGGLSISTTFLMAGLFIPGSRIPAFWMGLYYAVPTSHVLRALGTDQFYCAGGAAAGCPQISVPGATGGGAAGFQSVDRYAFVTSILGSTYGDRWGEIGWVAVAAGVMCVIAIVSLRFISHQKR